MSDFDRWYPYGFPISRAWFSPHEEKNKAPQNATAERLRCRKLKRLMSSLEQTVSAVRRMFDDPELIAKLDSDEIEKAGQWAECSGVLLETMAKALEGGKVR